MISKTLRGEIVAREAIRDKDKIKKRERAFKVPTSITFDNDGSEIYTLIEVDTRDRPGLLYDLTRTLAGHNVYIACAVIATYGEQVVDTFYVKDMFGLKFYSASKQKSLERKLREAIEAGGRARSREVSRQARTRLRCGRMPELHAGSAGAAYGPDVASLNGASAGRILVGTMDPPGLRTARRP